MIGYSSASNRSARKNMYRSPMKRNRRRIVSARRSNLNKSKKKIKSIKKESKGFKLSYRFKMYTYSSMKYIYEREERMRKKHP